MHGKFWSEDLKGRDHWEDLGVNGKNIRMVHRERGWEGVDWMHVAQDRDQQKETSLKKDSDPCTQLV
jgi:hypothetical protein